MQVTGRLAQGSRNNGRSLAEVLMIKRNYKLSYRLITNEKRGIDVMLHPGPLCTFAVSYDFHSMLVHLSRSIMEYLLHVTN